MIKINEQKCLNFLFETFYNAYYVKLLREFNYFEIMQLLTTNDTHYIIIHRGYQDAHVSLMRGDVCIGVLTLDYVRMQGLLLKHGLEKVLDFSEVDTSVFFQPETVLIEYESLDNDTRIYYDNFYKNATRN